MGRSGPDGRAWRPMTRRAPPDWRRLAVAGARGCQEERGAAGHWLWRPADVSKWARRGDPQGQGGVTCAARRCPLPAGRTEGLPDLEAAAGFGWCPPRVWGGVGAYSGLRCAPGVTPLKRTPHVLNAHHTHLS